MGHATGSHRALSRRARGRPLLIATLVLALPIVGLPAVATGDVAPAATRTETQRLVPSVREDWAEFGRAIVLDGDDLVAGMPGFNGAGANRGIAYGFGRTGSAWTSGPPIVASDPADYDYFGRAVSMDGDTLVVGAEQENSGDGAVYVYERAGSTWTFLQKLVAPDPRPDDAKFGGSVDVQGDRLVVGAFGYDLPSMGLVGIAYVFAHDGSTWKLEDTLPNPNADEGDRFGVSVALDGNRALVGAPGVDSFVGAAFVFLRDGTDWSEEQRLAPDDGGGWFGGSVGLCGGTALVGSYSNDGSRGAAYTYARMGGDWEPQQKLTAGDAAEQDWFGCSVAIEGDNAVIGARNDDDRGDSSGSAYVFARAGTTWGQRDKLLASQGMQDDSLGYSVTMSGDAAVAGALGEDSYQGAAYVFDGILGPYNPVEIAGATRYETAVEASKEAFLEGADTVVIATGENWPDALGGAALAGVHDAPILLTLGSSLPVTVRNEIDRLGATDVIILGGTGAVSEAVETELATLIGGTPSIRRIWGPTRYETAEAIAYAVASEAGLNYDGTAFVATGLNFPDALAGSPLAAAGDWPIFLAPATGLTPSTIEVMSDIGVSNALVLGGTGVVSQAVENGLAAGVSGDVTRLAGPTRYETAVEVATYGVDEAHLRWNGVALATGENFPDALAGGPVQGRKGSVMLLTHTATLTPATGDALEDEARDIAKLRFLGGPGALSQTVRDDVRAILE